MAVMFSEGKWPVNEIYFDYDTIKNKFYKG